MQDVSPLTRKLSYGAYLDELDVARLEALAVSANEIRPNADLVYEGDNPEFVHFVTSGVACRYKIMTDGRRAIVGLMLPGDFCDLHISLFGHMDHSVGALTACQVSRIHSSELTGILGRHPSINRAFLWAGLVEEAILRQWLVVQRRPADRQLAHFFCELYSRFKAVGMATEDSFPMPLTQTVLSEVLGQSAVHIQRIVGKLREEGYVVFKNRTVRIPDHAALAEFAEFDPGYLHLGRGNM